MSLNSFEEIRARRGRPAVVAGIVIWLLAAVSSLFVGLFTGVLTLFALGFPLQEITELFGADPSLDFLFVVGYFVPVLGALIGIPLAVVLADRIGAWVLEARAVDEPNAADQRIQRAVEAVALAAGEEPLLLLVDAPWIDAAALGRRDGRPAVVASTGAAQLDDDDLEILAGGVLADALAGNGASRARLATASLGLVPYVLGKKVIDFIVRRPRRFAIGLGAYLVVWTITILLTAGDADSDVELGPAGVIAPLAAIAFNATIVVAICFVIVTLVVWSGLLAALSLPIGARARKVADIGMASLVRDPAAWVSLMATAGHRPLHPPKWTRLVIAWLLPQTPAAADDRIAHLRDHVPGARHSLGHVPSVEQLSPLMPPPPVGDEAGWLPDPWGAARLRWFDGETWTHHSAD